MTTRNLGLLDLDRRHRGGGLRADSESARAGKIGRKSEASDKPRAGSLVIATVAAVFAAKAEGIHSHQNTVMTALQGMVQPTQLEFIK